MSLFKREPETLDGYVPKFSREECRLGYTVETIMVGGGFKSMDEPHEEYQHSITVLGHKIIAKGYISGMDSPFENAARIANEFLNDESNRVKHTDIFSFFKLHARNLTNSKRYWIAADYRARIEQKKLELAELTKEIERAEIIASLRALEVKEERRFTDEERQLHLSEFLGDTWVDSDSQTYSFAVNQK